MRKRKLKENINLNRRRFLRQLSKLTGVASVFFMIPSTVSWWKHGIEGTPFGHDPEALPQEASKAYFTKKSPKSVGFGDQGNN